LAFWFSQLIDIQPKDEVVLSLILF
jgi:hypothetical protein